MSEEPMESAESIVEVEIAAVVRGPNDRTEFDVAALQELAASIAQHGLAQPPTLRPVSLSPEILAQRLFEGQAPPCGPVFEVVAGERRTRAVRMLQWGRMPAIVRVMSDEQAENIMLIENVQRVDLNPVDEGWAYRRRIEAGRTEADLATVVHKTLRHVRRRVALTYLPPAMQAAIVANSLPLSFAEECFELSDDACNALLRLYRPTLTLSTWRTMVYAYRHAAPQEDLFTLFELKVESGFKVYGRGSQVVVPYRDELPGLEYSSTDGISDIICRYMRALALTGLEAEAEAVGALYATLIQSNMLAPPAHLASKTDEQQAAYFGGHAQIVQL